MLATFTAILLFISLFAIVAAYIPSDYWLIRAFEYPRPQLIVINIIAIFLAVHVFTFKAWVILISVILVWDILRHLSHIWPFTILGKKEVLDAVDTKNEQTLSLFHWNVFQHNRQVNKLKEKLANLSPDLILLCETDQWWIDSLSYLRDNYPYYIEIPLSNTYGLCLYSRYELRNLKEEYLVEESVPSVHADLVLEKNRLIHIHCLHPIPPAPAHSQDSIPRDGELLLVARRIEECKDNIPVLVCGDMNDVAWSKTTRLFQKISRLADPRRGRAIMPTFDARVPGLRVPIDQIFCSEHFRLISMRRLPGMGSDHHGLFIKLALVEACKAEEQLELDEPKLEDYAIAEQKIQESQQDPPAQDEVV